MRIAIANDNEINLSILVHIIEEQTEHTVAWTAYDGSEAINQCKRDIPDIILMDIVMPGINGVEASKTIMQNTPCAILIVTASVTGNAAMVFEAMSFGALDVVQTPFSSLSSNKNEVTDFLRKLNVVKSIVASSAEKTNSSLPNNIASTQSKKNTLVVIGSSTGGPGVLATILSQLPADFPLPIIIVQHVDSSFSESFSSWLNKQSLLDVRLASTGDRPKPGSVLIAGKSEHLVMCSNGKLAYDEEPKNLVYKPSVDVFFNSVAKQWKGSTIAVLLTGMGKDGALGLANIRQIGGHTITQTKDTCAVYGMPKAADDIGASIESLDPDKIIGSIMNIIDGKR